jgi:hypothetical protein
MSVPLSQRIDWPTDTEAALWAQGAIPIWNSDSRLREEFPDFLDFFDWSFAVSERLIRSAEACSHERSAR